MPFRYNVDFYRASICEGGGGSRNSVRLSVTRVHCDKTKWRTADILIPHERQSLCYSDAKRSWCVTPPSLWNRRSKWSTSLRKTPTSTDFFSFLPREHMQGRLWESYNSVRLSVRPSVTRVDCDKTKWRTADILIPHERAITLLLLYQQRLRGDAPFPVKSALKVTHPLRKTPTSTDFRS